MRDKEFCDGCEDFCATENPVFALRAIQGATPYNNSCVLLISTEMLSENFIDSQARKVTIESIQKATIFPHDNSANIHTAPYETWGRAWVGIAQAPDRYS